jgi:chromatin modification-related protein VID21
MLQQRNAQGQTPGVPPIAGGPRPPPPNGIQPPNGAPGSSGQTLQVPGQNRNPRPIPPQMSQQMGQQMGPQMQNNLRVPQGMNGVPPAPMQAMQGQLPMPNPAVSVGLINQAAQTAEQQRAMIQMQQQSKPNAQSPQPHNSPPRTSNGMQQPNAFQMQNMMAFNTNDHRSQAGTPPINGMVAPPGQGQHGPAGSPRPGQHPPVYNMEPYAARIDAQVRQQFPNATPEQILSLVTEQLKKTMQNQRSQPSNKLAQSAMNAAAGGSPASVPGMNGQVRGLSSGMNEKSPQLYAQMLRQQQENQHKADQARVAAAGLAAAQGQTAPAGNNGQQAQGHAHRNSAGSANSVK